MFGCLLSGGKVLFAPAEAGSGGVEFFFARGNHGLAGEGDKVALAFDAGVQAGADAPDAGTVFRVRARSDEKAVHGPVVVGAEGEAVVGLVVSADAKWDDVCGFNQGQVVGDFDPDATV